jgi:hypothetical protein
MENKLKPSISRVNDESFPTAPWNRCNQEVPRAKDGHLVCPTLVAQHVGKSWQIYIEDSYSWYDKRY